MVRLPVSVKIDSMEAMACGPFHGLFETHAISVKTHSVAYTHGRLLWREMIPGTY
jgi:hypothetical protein